MSNQINGDDKMLLDPIAENASFSQTKSIKSLLDSSVANVRADGGFLLTALPCGILRLCMGSPRSKQHLFEMSQSDAVLRGAWAALAGAVTRFKTSDEAGANDAVAVAVSSLVLGGYDGVLILWRKPGEGAAFAESDDVLLALAKAFETRPNAGATQAREPSRQFVFSKERCLFNEPALKLLDAELAKSIRASAARACADAEFAIQRAYHSDETKYLHPSTVVRFDSLPALQCETPVAVVSLSPTADAWRNMRADALASESELARFVNAVQFMVANARRGPSLLEIAGSVHMSQFHFHRRFSELFGQTPKHVQFDLQLDETTRMLADRSNALVDIARICGFAHQSHFTSRFKQGTGMTPTAWRKRLLQPRNA